MNVLIVSDTHGRLENLERVIEREEPIDMMVHLGDAEGEEEEIAQMAGCPLEIVAGNNDFFSDLPMEKEISIGRLRALITHGHEYCVCAGIADIQKEACARGMDIVMFGHTHRPLIDYSRGIVTLNPGSLSYPRQDGRRPSYIWMEVDKRGEAHYDIQYL